MNERSRRFAWLCWFALMLISRPASAKGEDCERIAALTEFEEDERANLRAACDGKPPNQPVGLLLMTMLRRGGWRAELAATILAPSDTSTSDTSPSTPPKQLIDMLFSNSATPTQTKHCEALRTKLGDYVHATYDPFTEGIPWLAPNSASAIGCLGKDRANELHDALGTHVMLAFIGLAKAEVSVYRITGFDSNAQPGASLETAEQYQIPTTTGWETVTIVWLPRATHAVIQVKQDDLDVGWYASGLYRHDTAFAPRSGDCLALEVGTDENLDWYAVLDGALVELERTSKQARRATPRTPDGPLEVVLLAHSPETSEWFWGSEQRVDASIERSGQCRLLRSDLRGLTQPRDPRYGVARISVDSQCREQGVTSARIQRYVELYMENAGAKTEMLETWADALEDFRELDGTFSREGAPIGASRRELDDRERLATLAAELRRQGVNVLLYVDVYCADPNAEPTVTGMSIDLRKFSIRARSQLTGVSTDGVLTVTSHSKRISELRGALDVVLGQLLRRTHLRLSTIEPVIESGSSHTLTAVAERWSAHDPDDRLELRVLRLPTSEAIATCALIERSNNLVSFTEFDELVGRLEQWSERWQTRPISGGPACEQDFMYTVHQPRKSESASARVCASDDLQAASTSVSVHLGGLREGNYVAFAWIDRRTPGGPPKQMSQAEFTATCFEVHERNFNFYMSFGGWLGPRGQVRRTGDEDAIVLRELRRDRVENLQITAGGRYAWNSFLEFGGEAGYSYYGYRASEWPAWNWIAQPVDPSSEASLSWRRHAMLFGGVVGVRFPFSRCYYRSSASCPEIGARASSFIRAHVRFNLGWLSDAQIGTTPAPPGISSSTSDFDVDLLLLGGVSLRPRRLAQGSIFVGLAVFDIDSGVAAIADPRRAAPLNYDFRVTPMIGFEGAWTIPTPTAERSGL